MDVGLVAPMEASRAYGGRFFNIAVAGMINVEAPVALIDRSSRTVHESLNLG